MPPEYGFYLWTMFVARSVNEVIERSAAAAGELRSKSNTVQQWLIEIKISNKSSTFTAKPQKFLEFMLF